MSYITTSEFTIKGRDVGTLPHSRLCNPSGMQITGFGEILCRYMQAHSYVLVANLLFNLHEHIAT
jgi:hypothetical protein